MFEEDFLSIAFVKLEQPERNEDCWRLKKICGYSTTPQLIK